MARIGVTYVCQACGAVHPRWAGQCDSCLAWNTITEERGSAPLASGAKRPAKGRPATFEGLGGGSPAPPRFVTGITEFDRVCGGGIVPGSVILVGGDPGIGKSTLLLQVSARLAAGGAPVAYVSGEEALDQIRLRAGRLGLGATPVRIAAETHVADILASLEADKPPALVIIDSIQTLWSDAIEAAPGTVSQVRASAQELVRYAKRRGAAVVLVGHVTKEGQIAGPRVVEHMVDAVLYFEGERGHEFRILRAVKNRYGPTDEIGVFEMNERGLAEVPNPSALFLSDRDARVPGTAVFAGIEGTRPLLVEIQALLAPTAFGTPRRAVVGWDTGRLSMVLAVLEARCGIPFGGFDIYLNVAGGLRINEPAADLAVAGALLSCLAGTPLPADAVIFGEVSLSGAIRAASQTEARLKEALKLGFKRALLPGPAKSAIDGLHLTGIAALAELASRFDLKESLSESRAESRSEQRTASRGGRNS
jgi:DNA repair protein RadA/Sms